MRSLFKNIWKDLLAGIIIQIILSVLYPKTSDGYSDIRYLILVGIFSIVWVMISMIVSHLYHKVKPSLKTNVKLPSNMKTIKVMVVIKDDEFGIKFLPYLITGTNTQIDESYDYFDKIRDDVEVNHEIIVMFDEYDRNSYYISENAWTEANELTL